MPRPKRIAKGNIVYHVLNRANGRLRIFKKPADYEAFEQILAEGLALFSMRLCGYCMMSNPWHLVVWPDSKNGLQTVSRIVVKTDRKTQKRRERMRQLSKRVSDPLWFSGGRGSVPKSKFLSIELCV